VSDCLRLNAHPLPDRRDRAASRIRSQRRGGVDVRQAQAPGFGRSELAAQHRGQTTDHRHAIPGPRDGGARSARNSQTHPCNRAKARAPSRTVPGFDSSTPTRLKNGGGWFAASPVPTSGSTVWGQAARGVDPWRWDQAPASARAKTPPRLSHGVIGAHRPGPDDHRGITSRRSRNPTAAPPATDHCFAGGRRLHPHSSAPSRPGPGLQHPCKGPRHGTASLCREPPQSPSYYSGPQLAACPAIRGQIGHSTPPADARDQPALTQGGGAACGSRPSHHQGARTGSPPDRAPTCGGGPLAWTSPTQRPSGRAQHPRTHQDGLGGASPERASCRRGHPARQLSPVLSCARYHRG